MKKNWMTKSSVLGILPVFVTVAKRRSFVGAARELGVSASAVSQSIAKLEEELGTPLLMRTTRSVSLTDRGARLLSKIEPVVGEAARALDEVSSTPEGPSGVLRLSVPRVACRAGLDGFLAAFAKKHPAVRVEVAVDDHKVDIVRGGFDAGIRSQESVERDMVTVRLTPPIRFVVVGSKRYFSRRPPPKHPRELVGHACLGWRSLEGRSDYRWEFEDRKRELEVAVSGPMASNDAELLISCAEAGMGLAYVTETEVARAVSRGALEVVLERFAPKVSGLFLYFPQAARKVPNVRAFVDCVREVGALGAAV